MLNELFEQTSQPKQWALIKRLREEGYDDVNKTGNTFVCCMVKADSDHVILSNIDTYCAPHFYRYCAENSDNPYLPRIHELKIFDTFSVAKMERLAALDHFEIDDNDKRLLESVASAMVRYIRGEASDKEMADVHTRDPLHERTVREILSLSQKIFYHTGGQTLPFCDLKEDNVFLRRTPGATQLVYGDPLYPGHGNNADNMQMMQNAYRRFGLPSLEMPVARISPSQP